MSAAENSEDGAGFDGVDRFGFCDACYAAVDMAYEERAPEFSRLRGVRLRL